MLHGQKNIKLLMASASTKGEV